MYRPTLEQINTLFPVIGIVLYPGGMNVRRSNNCGFQQANYSHERGKQTLVTSRSLNRLALLVRSSSVTFLSIQTLTYGANYPLSGRVAKRNLNSYLVQSKRVFGHYEYVWVLEFQERGAVHFHLATTLEPPTDFERSQFAELWQRISTPYSWSYCSCKWENDSLTFKKRLRTDRAVFEVHLDVNQWESVRKGDSLHAYFAKYANKLRQKVVPEWYRDVGRFWGASRGVSLPDGEVFYGKEQDVRDLVHELGRNVSHWQVLPKTILVG